MRSLEPPVNFDIVSAIAVYAMVSRRIAFAEFRIPSDEIAERIPDLPGVFFLLLNNTFRMAQRMGIDAIELFLDFLGLQAPDRIPEADSTGEDI